MCMACFVLFCCIGRLFFSEVDEYIFFFFLGLTSKVLGKRTLHDLIGLHNFVAWKLESCFLNGLPLYIYG